MVRQNREKLLFLLHPVFSRLFPKFEKSGQNLGKYMLPIIPKRSESPKTRHPQVFKSWAYTCRFHSKSGKTKKTCARYFTENYQAVFSSKPARPYKHCISVFIPSFPVFIIISYSIPGFPDFSHLSPKFPKPDQNLGKYMPLIIPKHPEGRKTRHPQVFRNWESIFKLGKNQKMCLQCR